MSPVSAPDVLPVEKPLPPVDWSVVVGQWCQVPDGGLVERPVSTADLGIGVLGFVLLPCVGLLDQMGVSDMPLAVAPPLAALFLSVPSLVVGHQYLGLNAEPTALMADVGRVFVRAGRLALGLVPVVGLFAATTGLGPMALALALLGIGVVSVELARRQLVRREVAGHTAGSPFPARMVLLATAWAGLSLLIAARMGLMLLAHL